MERRKLGANGPEVSAIGLGCMGMSFLYGTPDDEESAKTLHRAIELGIDFLDTAEVYGFGKNEVLLGEALTNRRDKVLIASKFGFDEKGIGLDGSPENVRRACEASLARLQTDVIDLYYIHRVDPDVPVEETIGAMAELIEAGKVRMLGLCEASPEIIRRAHATHPLTAVQSEYSLWTRNCEAAVLPLCRELGIAYVAYSPLGRGFLTGSFASRDDLDEKDRRLKHPRFHDGNFEKNTALLDPVREIAAARDLTPAQVALAWVLARGNEIIPIPGTKRRTYLEQNAAAVDVTLTGDEIAALEAAFPPDAAAGTRYPEVQMPSLGM